MATLFNFTKNVKEFLSSSGTLFSGNNKSKQNTIIDSDDIITYDDIFINSRSYEKLTKELEYLKNAADSETKFKKSQKQQELENLEESVRKLHEFLNQIPLNTQRLKLAKSLFEQGKFKEADVALNEKKMREEGSKLQKINSEFGEFGGGGRYIRQPKRQSQRIYTQGKTMANFL